MASIRRQSIASDPIGSYSTLDVLIMLFLIVLLLPAMMLRDALLGLWAQVRRLFA